jgi:choline dehydrogenase-like flavoprotein
MGLFYETAPLHPMLASTVTPGFGRAHLDRMKLLPYTAAHIALGIDGFDATEEGGTVTVRPSGAPLIDYARGPRLFEAMREGLRWLARINFAVGAREIVFGDAPEPVVLKSERDLGLIEACAIESYTLFSAHVMGGCAMGDDAKTSVVRSRDLRHHTVENLHVVDGSVFPTALGVNPQLSIYGLAHLVSTRLAQSWKG